jgi:hypothetical protein
MRIALLRVAFFSFIIVIVFSCNKTEQFQTEPLSNYIPLVTGKYITYRVDSTVFINFGRTTVVHNYLVKHVVDAQVTDNLGRPSFRVFKFIRDTASTQPWTPNGSYFVTPFSDRIELIEDNLRIIKMHLPIRDGYSWKGNKYLPTNPYRPLYTFSNDDNMADWDFYFNGAAKPTDSIMGRTYPNVYTIQEDDEAYNVPIADPHAYAARSLAIEKYSQNIGLVYRELTLWEQQPNPTGNPPNIIYDPYRIGFGMKMWMIDHN